MGFGRWAEMGPKVDQKWVFGCKVGQMGQNPLFHPLETHVGRFTKTHFLPSFKGGGNCFPKRALRQSRPSITFGLVFFLPGKEKPINIKNFGGTPPGVRPVCPGDTSHLSRDMSRLSRGHSVPLLLIYT